MGIWKIAKGVFYNMVTSPTRKDIDALIAIIRNYRLVGWDASELDQLSRGHSKKKIRKIPKGVSHGVYQSIYHEPILSYAIKQYGNKSKKLIVIRINNDHFAFLIKGNRGSFDSDAGIKGGIDLSLGIVFQDTKYQVIIDTTSKGDLIEVTVNGHALCFVNRQTDTSLTHLRVVRYAKEHDPQLDKLLQLSVAFGLIDGRL